MVYTLLVVDDEPYITDSLVNMFEDSELEVEVHCAYNAKGALDISKKYRIDVLLTDIRMPGDINGLELQKMVREMWPLCQVVFLTGHNEFEYAQNAIRGGSNDFILKTEDDDVVIRSVGKAIKKLDDIIHEKEVLELADEYIKRSKPLLKERFFRKVALGIVKPNEADFKMMGIELSPEREICLMVGTLYGLKKVDVANASAVISLIRQYLTPKFIIEEYIPKDDQYIWFIQPKEEDRWINDFGFLNATLDTIQSICRSKLGIEINLIVNSFSCAWSDADYQINRLRNILRQSQVPKSASVMTDQYAEKFIKHYDIESIHEVRKHIDMLEMIPEWIENGDGDVVKHRIEMLVDTLKSGVDYHTLVEAKISLGLLFIKYINNHNLAHKLTNEFGAHSILSANGYALTKLKDFYNSLVDELLKSHQKEIAGQSNRVVLHIDQYIKSHLDGDLSLTNLSQIVYLNPSYLSRLYKSHTGSSISDTINILKIEKAKYMLQNTYLRINQIGQEIGYVNPAHFTRYFKKLTGITPNDYRTLKSNIS